MNEHQDSHPPESDNEPKSKSQRKREMLELQDLGHTLSELRPDQLNGIPMDDSLRQALDELKAIRSHEARRRQLQYVGKLMRGIDTAPIRQALAGVQTGNVENTRRLHLAEKWRERLIGEGDAAVTDFMALFPAAEAQHLRNLARNARRDLDQAKNRGNGRKLFRYIRELVDSARSEATDGNEAEEE